MRRPFGRDRVLIDREDRVVLSSPIAKDWLPRSERRGLPHPGTAVEWDDQQLEVTQARPAGAGFLYELRPWDESHVIRRLVRYDEESEQLLQAEYDRARRANQHRTAARLMLPLYGLLPAPVQQRIEHGLGIPTSRQTLVSSLTFLAIGAAGVGISILSTFRMIEANLPIWLIIFIAYLFAESSIRTMLSLSQTRAFGSLLTEVPYAIYLALTTPRASLPKTVLIPPSAEQADADAFRLFEPVAALLPAGDQERLVSSFGFNAIRWGRITAVALLVASALGVYSGVTVIRLGRPGVATVLSMAIAVLLLLEQLLRLSLLLRREIAGSLLGYVVRPFAAKRLHLDGPDSTKDVH